MEKTIICEECGFITDVELTDINAPRYCPECGGNFAVDGTGDRWPVPSSVLSGFPAPRALTYSDFVD